MSDHPYLNLPDTMVKLDVVRPGQDFFLKTSTENLTELALEFAPFTTGLLHTYGGLDVDPVREFVDSHPDQACNVACKDFDQILFRGIARNGTEEYWDRRLFFIEKRFWPDLKTFLCNWSVCDSVHRTYAEIRAHVVPLPYQPGQAKPYATAFTLSSNHHHLELRVDPTAPLLPARVVRLPIEARIAHLASKAFQLGAEAIHVPRMSP